MELNKGMILKQKVDCDSDIPKFVKILQISHFHDMVIIESCYMDINGKIIPENINTMISRDWLESTYIKWSGEKTDFKDHTLSEKEKIVKSLKRKGIRI